MSNFSDSVSDKEQLLFQALNSPRYGLTKLRKTQILIMPSIKRMAINHGVCLGGLTEDFLRVELPSGNI